MAAHRKSDQRRVCLCAGGFRKCAYSRILLDGFRELQDAQLNRLTRNSFFSETFASRNRGLAIHRHADQFG
jgi:hypothetical protein